MKLIITSPEHHHEAQIAWLELNGQAGNFVILPGHAPMILSLLPASTITYCLHDGHQKTITVSGGLAHITRNDITLLLSQKPLS